MLRCASAAVMPAAPHTAHSPTWSSLHPAPTVKSEPMDEGNYSKEQTSGFYSESFQSASPTSSKSNDDSPRSVGSGGESAAFYDNAPSNSRANVRAQVDISRSRPLLYSMLTPPGHDNLNNEGPSLGYDTSRYSPESLAPPVHESTPIATPPKSPGTPLSPGRDNDRRFDHFNYSGLDAGAQEKNDSEDGRVEAGLEDDFDVVAEPNINVPSLNSHGKMKTFKCKQCNYVSVTKAKIWDHHKSHIKPEKMLCCRHCPFVTEYKHHLEYHMRNHLGSKPFHCPQCSYSCVNKSMLNSHLKSHSNIYQYHCAECNYATKYCHSLKLHLRKYRHKPGVVLNMDGTPNPLPIIDVYGTRRGPKQKPLSKILGQQASVNNSQPPAPAHSLYSNHFPVNLPYFPPFLPQPFLYPPQNNMDQKDSVNQTDMATSSASILHNRLSYTERPTETATSPKSPVSEPQVCSSTPPPANDALDLTNGKTSEAGSPQANTERPVPVTPTTSNKNRRKGPAFKLQPAALRLQHEDEKTNRVDASESEPEEEIPTTTATNTYTCQYCDITFGDLTMHTIHMGFHGYNDPFMCNKCGERSADRVSFFIHLGRVQHA
ncbi:protein hunchback [Amyelois transitella]|uniref:protein hunchback n=1 Tax=Amyelois transitella TaxID=680683 RepID=UPI00298FE44E|nr:protein hunchback [Amyelois transitella]